ncbi:MAG: DUF2156 domain-containing protein [Myxococcales bacterium]|nr:DUF2156 domain-containing protein [Myxococcales bacterium]
MSSSPALAAGSIPEVALLPAPVPARDWLRALLTSPARLLDRLWTARALPVVPMVERHRRLVRSTPPEGWLALQPGLATVGDRDTWTSFVARGDTALAVGGVHGVDRSAAFASFREETAALGISRHALYPLRAADLHVAQAAGFETLPIGVEAWVDLDAFTLRGKRFADLRQMRNRAAKRGVVVEEVDPAVWRGAIEATWRRFVGTREVPWQVRWLSGGPVFDASWGHRTFVAHLHGDVQAFCTILPGPDGTAGLDVMCRDPDAAPGSMDALLVHVLRQLREEGLRSVSLGPCPLAGGTPEAVSGALGLAMRWAWGSAMGDRWFGFRRLAAFKAKFRPRHEVVHLGLAPGRSALSLYLVARIWALGD